MSKSARKRSAAAGASREHGSQQRVDRTSTSSPEAKPIDQRPAVAWVSVLLVIGAAIAVYFNTLGNEFVYDDMLQVLKNPWIKSFQNLPGVFLGSAWSFQGDDTISNYYRPMMHLVYMINYRIYGLVPWGFHFTNVLLHAGCSVMVYLVARQVFVGQGTPVGALPVKHPNGWFAASGPLAPLVAALVFAVHPIHTEVVAWIACVPELVFTWSYLLALYLFLISERPSRWLSPWLGIGLSALFYMVSCFSKETALTLPLLFLAHDSARRGRIHWGRYVPYVLITAGYLFVRHHAIAGFAPERKHQGLGLYEAVLNAFPLLAEYLYKLILPTDLNAFHVLHPVRSLLEAKTIVSILIVGTFLGAAFLARRLGKGTVFFSLCLIFLPLVPVLYAPVLGYNAFTERYLYLPTAGFAFLLWIGLGSLNERVGNPLLPAVVGLALVTAYSVQTVQRNRIWATNLALFSDTVSKAPDSNIPHELLGTSLLFAGRIDEGLQQYAEAEKFFPGSPTIASNRGRVYFDRNDYARAVTEFEKAVSADPGVPEYRYKLAVSYLRLGKSAEALEQYRGFLALENRSADAFVKVGIDLGQAGLQGEAAAMFEGALAVDPGNRDAHFNLGTFYANSNRAAEAGEHFLAAVKSEPDNPGLRNALGLFYEKIGRYADAVEQYETAVRLAPGQPQFEQNLDRVRGVLRDRGSGG